ncbi:MAG TPA: PDZ domain-containing protein [Thermoanaerobaculia bacterium]
MTHRISRIFIVAVIAAATLSAEEPKCSAAARECDHQIRQMLRGRRFLGVTVEERAPGLMIKAVVANSPAERAGLRAGDRLIAINGKSLTQASTRDFKQTVAEARDTGRLWMIISRGGVYAKVETRLEPYTKEQIARIVAAHLLESHTAKAGVQ